MIKIGVRAHDYGCHPPVVLARQIAEAGFETVQLAPHKALTGVEQPENATDALLDETHAAFAEAGVGIDVLGCYVAIGSPDKDERALSVALFLRALAHAKRLGAPFVATETSPFTGNAFEHSIRYKMLLSSALRIAEWAERFGVTACFEPVAAHTLDSAELARRLLDDVDSSRLKIVFDPVNLLTADNLPDQDALWDNFIDLLGADIAAMHIRDVDECLAWQNIGRGVVRYDRIFNRLKAHNLPLLREEAHPESAALDIEAMRGFI